LILAAAVWVAAELVSGIFLEGVYSTLLVAAILGLINLFVRPIFFFLSLPLTVITLGLFILVLNALMLLLADWIANIDSDILFDVDDIWSAILGSIIISIVSFIISRFVDAERLARMLTPR
jgi:putative membrane protein